VLLILLNKVLWHILVEPVVGLWNGLIGLEPRHELGVLVALNDIINFIVGMEKHHLLILNVDGKMIHCGRLLVHWKLKDMPRTLNGTHIMPLDVISDLIHLLLVADLDSSHIVPLVDVLVDVLDCLDRCANLYIDMTVVLG